MKQALKKSLQAAALIPMLVLGLSVVTAPFGPAAHAAPVQGGPDCDVSITGGADCSKTDEQQDDLGETFKIITNVLLFIIGAVSVIMLIIGGIRYTVSGGDSSAVTGAKNTILYAIVGIVVALLAFAVVNFVLGQFSATA